MTKEEQARRAGMAYAYAIAKDKGIDGLKKEIEFRNITKCPLAISQEKLDEYSNKVKQQTVDSIMALALCTLRDEFDFGGKRLKRFWERFNFKAECLDGNYVEWSDYLAQLEEECGIKLEMNRPNDVNTKI